MLDTILGCVAAGMGYALLSRSLVEAQQQRFGVHWMTLPGRSGQELAFVDTCFVTAAVEGWSPHCMRLPRCWASIPEPRRHGPCRWPWLPEHARHHGCISARRYCNASARWVWVMESEPARSAMVRATFRGPVRAARRPAKARCSLVRKGQRLGLQLQMRVKLPLQLMIGQALALQGLVPGRTHALLHSSAALPFGRCQKLLRRQCRHLHMQIDAVQQGPADARLITCHLIGEQRQALTREPQ